MAEHVIIKLSVAHARLVSSLLSLNDFSSHFDFTAPKIVLASNLKRVYCSTVVLLCGIDRA